MVLDTAMSPTIDLPSGQDTYEAALEGLVRLGQVVLRRVRLPNLYDSGVRYKLDPPGPSHWLRPDEVLARGVADCKNLASWRAAELRESGDDPDARVTVYRTGIHSWHAVVARSDGTIEDPSRKLGMGQRSDQMSGKRDYIGDDPVKTLELTWSVDRTPSGGWAGTVRVPIAPHVLADLISGDGGYDDDDGEYEDDGYDEYGDEDGAPSEPTHVTVARRVASRLVAQAPNAPAGVTIEPKAAYIVREHKDSPRSAQRSALQAAGKLFRNPAFRAMLAPQAALALKLAGSEKARSIAKGLFKHFF